MFSLKRSEQSVGSEFSIENMELFSPLPSLRNFCADFEDVLLGVTQASGMKGLAEKAEIGCGAEKKAGSLQGFVRGTLRIWPGLRMALGVNRLTVVISWIEVWSPFFSRSRQIRDKVSPDFTI